MFEPLIKRSAMVINVTPDSYRAMPAEKALQSTLEFNPEAKAFDSIEEGLVYAEREAKKLENPLIIATGSLYLASDVKKFFNRTI